MKKASSKKNVVEEAVEKVGGPVQAAALMRVTVQTVYRWKSQGSIPLAVPAILMAKASGFKLEKLVGLE